MTNGKLVIGTIRTSHGLNGFLKINSYSGDAAYFRSLKMIYLKRGIDEKEFTISEVKQNGKSLLIKLTGIDSPEEGKKYNTWEIRVDRENANPLEEGEYYLADLCKCTVVKNGFNLGTVKSVCEGAPDDLLEIVTENGTYLVPFLERFIGEVNIKKETIELKADWLLQ